MSSTSPQSFVAAVRSLIAALLMVAFVAPLALAALEPERAELFSPQPDEKHLQALGDKLAVLDHYPAIREIYERYEEVARKSGYEFELELSQLTTVTPEGYRRHAWLDLMTLPTGWRIRQVPNYYEAPWLDGKRVFYELSWEKETETGELQTFEMIDEVQGNTIREALDRLVEEGHLKAIPVAVTAYQVRVRLNERRRTYRAFALWFEQGQDFELQIQDHVIPEVDTAMAEEVQIITGEEYRNLTEGKSHHDRGNGPFREIGQTTVSGECVAYNKSFWHSPLENTDVQGHSAGYHFVRMSVKADCTAGTDCHLQCNPTITEKTCAESSNADVVGTCKHYPQRMSQISGSSANGEATACGGAVACGVKECCSGWCTATGGINFHFSGSGGGLTASVSSSGSHTVYDVSASDSVECPAPDEQTRCATTSSTVAAGRVTSALFLPCDDGGNPGPGPDEPNPSDGGSQGDGTPILLDLGGSGFELTDLAGGVAFDLDADGTPEPISWTAAGSDDAFLVLDRDGDGAIDDGSELFGDATPQPPSAEPHGYRALAVFDEAAAGGDGDGRITAADAVFADLELWRDADHDGVADAGERQSLADAGVVALELDYVESRRRDRHGNLVRYTSRFEVEAARGRSLKVAADVIFLQAQP